MTLKTIPISITITAPDGTPAAGANVLAELTAYEIDGMIIVPSKVSATTDTAGVAVMRLWPNARGAAGSQYRIAAVKAGVLLLNVLATVPDGLSTTEIPLQAIITTAPYPPVSESLAALLAAQAAAVDALQQADIATAKAVLAADAVVLTHADVEATGADADATAADRIQTDLDRIATGQDADLTHADVLTTARHAAATAADVLTLAPVTAALPEIIAVSADLVAIHAVKAKLPEIDVVAMDLSNIDTVASSIASVDIVAENAGSVTVTANAINNVNTVAGAIGNVGLVAGNTAPINIVAGSIASVTSAATNMAAILAAPARAQTASDKADAAAASANAAAASFDSFDDRFLGAKVTAPTLDNDGGALLTGALYWDAPLAALRVWTGAAWTNTIEIDDRVLADQQLLGGIGYAIDMALQAVREIIRAEASLIVRANAIDTTVASYDTAITQAIYELTHLLDLVGVTAVLAASCAKLVAAPANASAAGTKGETAYDANYFYVCTALNTWKRVALATW